MKEIDTNQEWFKNIPAYKQAQMTSVEAEAITARENGLLFYTLVLACSQAPVDISTILTIIAQTGWELITITHQPTHNSMQYFFKKA